MKQHSLSPRRTLVTAMIFLLTAAGGALDAGTIHVPGDYPDIQAGIDASSAGDTVLVEHGTYTGAGNKNLDFYGKDIVLESDDSEFDVVIDCEEDGRGFFFQSAVTAAAEVRGFTILNGFPGEYEIGAGVNLGKKASPTFTACTIDGNTTQRGGGIFCDSYASPAFIGCSIKNNDATGNFGGGIYSDEAASPSFTDCIVEGNSSANGAGAAIWGEAVFDGCSIVANSNRGLWIDGGDVLLTDCDVSGNSPGGGIYVGHSIVTFENCTITSNSGLTTGGLHVLCTDAVLIDCTISGNSRTDDDIQFGGAGIFFSDCQPILIRCLISDNESASRGGGLEFYNDARGMLTDCVITGNSARRGGGVYSRLNAAPHFFSCRIEGNTAVPVDFSPGYGGGFYCEWDSDILLTNCLVTGNVASGSGAKGGAFYLEDSSPELMNCTLSDNNAVSFFGDPLGGGFYCDESDPVITNCILWSDEPDEIHCAGSSAPAVQYSDIEGGWTGWWNIDADPEFIHPASGNYYLNASSPCIDAGTGAGAPVDDIEDDARPAGDGWDMGADEYVCDLSVVLSAYPSTIEPGQTLSFTAAAVNDCGESHSFDEAKMVIEGPAGLEKALYDGASITIPAGGEVSAPVSLYVPMNAPAGVYTITVVIYRTFLWSIPVASDSIELEVLG